MQNIEFKAELRDMALARAQAQALGARLISIVEQRDTYYKLPDGRLKKREAKGEPTEWIFYHRPDRAGPRMSHFTLYSDDQARLKWGTASLREWVTVRKRREIFMIENVRIHLDEVESLGCFIEFEALCSRKWNVKRCHEEIADLRSAFAPILGEAISGSYSDLVDRLARVREL